ncbi:MAG TPA: antitoxin Xre/MbcA/ParS toxin-binding domain-containing protein [Bryobacteraceae bacterium]|nr:antitoxin Xre/MbcA/ParS toxin-binding domain-containing protein [Bryobacteraceae bacterium]
MAANAMTLRTWEILGGEKTLGRPVSNQRDLAEAVREGLPHAALESVTRLLGLSVEALSSSLALSKRTLSRRRTQERLSTVESDRLLRLARVAAMAVQVLGNEQKASEWLKRPNRALANATPLSELDTDPGARAVEQLLGRIEHGVFS